MKTLAQYLTEHGGNHEAAAAALHADLLRIDGDREREASANIRARTIAQAAEPLLRALDVPVPAPGQRPTEDATSALKDGVEQATQAVEGLEEGIELWESFAEAAGLDVDAVLKADSPDAQQKLMTDFLGTLDATAKARDTVAQELNVYRFAAANGLKPDAVMLQRGLEKLELREVEVTGEGGQKKTEQVWQLPGKAEGEYVSALDYLQPVMPALKAAPATPQGTAWVGGQESRADTAPASPFAGLRPAPAAGATAPVTVSPFHYSTGGKST